MGKSYSVEYSCRVQAFWHTRAFHQQYTIKALGKELTAFRDLCRALVHLLSSDETLKILIQNETLNI